MPLCLVLSLLLGQLSYTKHQIKPADWLDPTGTCRINTCSFGQPAKLIERSSTMLSDFTPSLLTRNSWRPLQVVVRNCIFDLVWNGIIFAGDRGFVMQTWRYVFILALEQRGFGFLFHFRELPLDIQWQAFWIDRFNFCYSLGYNNNPYIFRNYHPVFHPQLHNSLSVYLITLS